MRLLVQPEDGVFPVLKAIQKARRSIDMHIFRLDSKEIEKALAAAVARGVVVRTLIAHTNARGEKGLRKLEQRLLALGATVSRTADDLLRYHGKMMIVDSSWLFVFAFNLTKLDIDGSRSLGVATRKRALVQEALRLFEADFDRKPYSGGAQDFLVSPVNARERLAAFLKRGEEAARTSTTSPSRTTAMIRILQERAKAGVVIRIIGKVEKGHGLEAEKFPGKRQHLRCIVRDGRAAFVGSQSLRKLELDARREIGVIVRDAKLVRADRRRSSRRTGPRPTRGASRRARRRSRTSARTRTGNGKRSPRAREGSGHERRNDAQPIVTPGAGRRNGCPDRALAGRLRRCGARGRGARRRRRLSRPAPATRPPAFTASSSGRGTATLWTLPIEVEVLDLASFSGGLVAEKKGGGKQTQALRFEGADGREWRFRSVDKDPSSRAPDRAQGLVRRLASSRTRSARRTRSTCSWWTRSRTRSACLTSSTALVVLPDDPAARRVPRGVRGHAGHARGEPVREVAGDARVRGLHEDRGHRGAGEARWTPIPASAWTRGPCCGRASSTW